MAALNLIPLPDYIEYTVEEMLARSQLFCDELKRRRTIRDFSDRKIPKQVIDNCISAANSAPSGANKQPWHFVVVSKSVNKKEIKSRCRRRRDGSFIRHEHRRSGLMHWHHLVLTLTNHF